MLCILTPVLETVCRFFFFLFFFVFFFFCFFFTFKVTLLKFYYDLQKV